MEARNLESIGFVEKPFDPYCHLESCHQCKQQKMCVEGFRSVGNERPVAFYECEDCARETKQITYSRKDIYFDHD